MAANQGMAVAGCNYVGKDQIWKDHVKQEVVAAKKWPNNWEFLTIPYEELVKDEITRTKRSENEMRIKTQVRKVTPMEDYTSVKPSPKPVPASAASMIGWRSSKDDLALEIYGGYARPKGNLVKTLKWPLEAI